MERSHHVEIDRPPSRQSNWIRPFLRLQKLAQQRASITSVRRLSDWSERFFVLPKDIRREDHLLDGRRHEWITPKDSHSERVIFYIHGGGFALPLYNPSRYVAATLARASAMRALLVEYRLAPEHPFPAALDDCVAAYEWLITDAGVLPEHIFFVGESAGGNLVITTMLALRDANRPLPSAAVAVCPAFDFEGGGSFFQADDPMVDAGFIMRMLDAYRGDADPRDPRLSPIYADLSGLPPLLIQTGGSEILRSGAETLASRAIEAGVSTQLEIWPGMWHYWHMAVNILPEAQDALHRISQFLHSNVEPEAG